MSSLSLTKTSALQRTVLISLLALLVASLTVSTSWGPRPAGAVGQASGVYFGAYGGSEELSSTQKIANVGVQGARMYIEWAALEPSEAYTNMPLQSSTKLNEYDQRLRNLASVGVKPILMIGRAPNWAASRERGPLYPGKEAAFANFMRKLVERWSVAPYNVKHWELWPEPDFGGYIPDNIREPAKSSYEPRRAWGDNGADYATMLKATYPVIKQADPSATVIMGSMAFDLFRNNSDADPNSSPGFNQGGVFVYHFLDDVIDAGGACCFDWVAFNSYSIFATGWEQNTQGEDRDLVAKANHIRAKMARKGVDKPLLTLEAGIWSCCINYFVKPDGNTERYTPDERTQAAYLAKLYARGLAADLKGVYWYLVYDQQPPDVLTDPDQHRGWWRTDLSPKPAVRTMQLMTSRLTGATFGGAYTGATVESGAIEAYSFTRSDGRNVIMMWSPYGPNDTARVKVSGVGAIVYNAHGETVATERADGNNIRLTVGYSPVFIEQFGNLGNRSVIPNVPRNQAGG